MNILTFDIEEWALTKAKGMRAPEKYVEYDAYLNRILDTLDNVHTKGTFFCTGMMAEEFPRVIKLIQSRGHEIGCHSYRHTWMNKLSKEEATEDTHRAIDALEQCIGQKVTCYRAPAFSIGENNKWMFEIFAQNGIIFDSSIFPAVRDFGGFPSFSSHTPCIIEYEGVKIKEFPICTTKLLGQELAYSGGGYFRFFPLWFVRKEMEKSDYSMTYFHIGDLIPETNGVMSKADFESYFKTPGTLKNRYSRYIKSNLGKKKAFSKLLNLIASEDFVNLEQADKMIDWQRVLSIRL